MKDLYPLEREPTTHSYPYDSELAAKTRERRESGEEIDEWVEPGFDVKDAIEHLAGPIVELAGPTETGHYYLDGVQLPSQPVISNIAEGTLANGARDASLDQLLDVRHLDFPDDSIDMMIAAHLPVIDEEDFDFSNLSDEMDAEYSRRQRVAEQAIEDIARSGNLDEASARQSLRLAAALEIHRCLKLGGFYLTDGTETEKVALQRLGYKLVAAVNANASGLPPYYYMMLEKISDPASA